MRWLLSMVIALIAVQCLKAQKIAGTVMHAETKDPIADVFVFFDNSSVGTVTDSKGRFQLDTDGGGFDKIVLSHLNFELAEFEVKKILSSNQQAFYLVAKDLILDEAIVKAKAKPKLRARAFKRFRDAFVGDIPTKHVKIENPEVLLFNKSGNHFLATTESPIIISNKLLGYKMTFFLKEFRMKDKDWVDYSGQVFFEEINAEKKATAKFKRNRKKIYQRSSRKFFRDLAAKEFAELDYKIAFSDLDLAADEFSNLQEVDSLHITRPSSDAYALASPKCLTIVDLNTVSKHKVTNTKSGKLGQKTFQEATLVEAVSHLRPRGSHITFNRFGRILNANEVEEYGYWAGLRVGSLLPLDYDP